MRYARKPGSMLDYSDHVGSLVSHLALVVLVIFWLQCMFMMLIVGDRGILLLCILIQGFNDLLEIDLLLTG